jgi:hypothetical protein
MPLRSHGVIVAHHTVGVGGFAGVIEIEEAPAAIERVDGGRRLAAGHQARTELISICFLARPLVLALRG